MKTIACLLMATLAVEAVPAAVTTRRSPNECAPADDICRAEILVARAKAESDPRRRAIDWNAACRAYLAAHAKSSAAEELCAARRSCEASLAIEGLSAGTRTSLESGRKRLEEREAAAGRPVCGKTATQKPAGGEKPRVARAAVKRAAPMAAPPTWMSGAVGESEATRGSEGEGVEVAGGQVEAPAREGESQRVAEVDAVAEDGGLMPVTRSSGGLASASRERRPGRGLVIAGGVALGLGLGLGGVAGWAGHRARLAYDEGVRLHEGVEGPPDAATLARDEELKAEYQRMGAVALVSGIAGGVALVTGAILAGVGGRRLRRVESAIQPAPGGLAVHVRF